MPQTCPAQTHRANGCAGLAVRFHSCSLRQGSLFRFLPCLQMDKETIEIDQHAFMLLIRWVQFADRVTALSWHSQHQHKSTLSVACQHSSTAVEGR